jgi:hypothetical protein
LAAVGDLPVEAKAFHLPKSEAAAAPGADEPRPTALGGENICGGERPMGSACVGAWVAMGIGSAGIVMSEIRSKRVECF